jgi:hypothetical protein
MVCVKQLNVVGGTESNLFIGKQYNVSPIPTPIPEDDEMKEPEYPRVWVWLEGLEGESLYQPRIYPMDAFVTLDIWRQQQLNKLI